MIDKARSVALIFMILSILLIPFFLTNLFKGNSESASLAANFITGGVSVNSGEEKPLHKLSQTINSDNLQQEFSAYKIQTNQQLAKISTELSELKAAVEELKLARQEQAPAVNQLNRHDPAARAEDLRKRQEFMAAEENAFQRQIINKQWSTRITAKLRDVLNTDLALKNAAEKIECRANQCRVQLVDFNELQHSGAIQRLLFNVAEDLPQVSFHTKENGEVVLFMSHGLDSVNNDAR